MRWRDQSGATRVPRPEQAPARLRQGRRPRIGVLVDSLRKTYQTTLLAGIAEAAFRRDVDIVVFAGGVLGAPGSDGLNRNFVFDLCDKRSLDGAIILGGALGNFLGTGRRRGHLRAPGAAAARQHRDRAARRPRPARRRDARHAPGARAPAWCATAAAASPSFAGRR